MFEHQYGCYGFVVLRRPQQQGFVSGIAIVEKILDDLRRRSCIFLQAPILHILINQPVNMKMCVITADLDVCFFCRVEAVAPFLFQTTADRLELRAQIEPNGLIAR